MEVVVAGEDSMTAVKALVVPARLVLWLNLPLVLLPRYRHTLCALFCSFLAQREELTVRAGVVQPVATSLTAVKAVRYAVGEVVSAWVRLIDI